MATVNEITSMSLAYSQVLGRVGDSQPASVRKDFPPPRIAEENSAENVAFAGFVSLAAAKDEVIQGARSIRETHKALDAVDGVLKELNQAVQLVKNYPPFPQGNEKRVDYITAINGLRQQLEALEIPPVKGGQEAVFYPRESGLPQLDPVTATDADILSLGQALDELRLKVNDGYVSLQKQAQELPEKINADLPAETENTIRQRVEDVKMLLADTSQALVTVNSGLSQLSS